MRKSIFITGAAQGIGRAVALRFAKQDWRVCATDIDSEGLEALKAEIGDTHFFHVLNVTDVDAVKSVLAKAVEPSGGKLDVLLNNAGILRDDHFEAVSLSGHDLLIDVNIKGVTNCTYLAYDYLKAVQNSSVINMSSASSQYGVPTIASYSASKFFVKGLSEALAVEWKRHGIHVCSIAPTFVTTTMTKGDERTQIFKNDDITVNAEDVAETVWAAAHKRDVYEWHVENTSAKIRRFAAKIMPRSLLRRELAKASGYPI